MVRLGRALASGVSALLRYACLQTWTSWACSTASTSEYPPTPWSSAPAYWTASLTERERQQSDRLETPSAMHKRLTAEPGRPLYWPAMTVRRVEYEVERVRLGRHLSHNAVRQFLTDHAEYGGWELARLRRYRDGTRDAWIRRKIIRFPGR
jgi:Family of unknown function (DUF5703)